VLEVMERVEQSRVAEAKQKSQAERERQADLARDVNVDGKWRTVRITDGVPWVCTAVTLEFMRGELRVRSGDYHALKSYSIERRSGGDLSIMPEHESDNGNSDCRGQTAQLASIEWDEELLLERRASPPNISHCVGGKGCIFLHRVPATD